MKENEINIENEFEQELENEKDEIRKWILNITWHKILTEFKKANEKMESPPLEKVN